MKINCNVINKLSVTSLKYPPLVSKVLIMDRNRKLIYNDLKGNIIEEDTVVGPSNVLMKTALMALTQNITLFPAKHPNV